MKVRHSVIPSSDSDGSEYPPPFSFAQDFPKFVILVFIIKLGF